MMLSAIRPDRYADKFCRYYWGILQWLIAKMGWFFLKTLNISGAEAVVAAASPFIGQGESACMVKPYVNQMTSSEIHQVHRQIEHTILI